MLQGNNLKGVLAFAALAGSLYAHFVSFINPPPFDIFFSIKVLMMVVIGGIGSVWGAFLGATLLTFLPEWLAFLEDFDVLANGLILLLIVIFSPDGFEGRQLFTSLKVLDNLLLGAYLIHSRKNRGEIERRLRQVYQLFPKLEERAGQVAGTLSGGEQQMVSIGRALMIRPKLLMLDAPSMGLAPLVIRDILRTIVGLNRQGVTVLLVEQNARATLSISARAYVLETGKVVHQGFGADLLHDPKVIEDYLGG